MKNQERSLKSSITKLRKLTIELGASLGPDKALLIFDSLSAIQRELESHLALKDTKEWTVKKEETEA